MQLVICNVNKARSKTGIETFPQECAGLKKPNSREGNHGIR